MGLEAASGSADGVVDGLRWFSMSRLVGKRSKWRSSGDMYDVGIVMAKVQRFVPTS